MIPICICTPPGFCFPLFSALQPAVHSLLHAFFLFTLLSSRLPYTLHSTLLVCGFVSWLLLSLLPAKTMTLPVSFRILLSFPSSLLPSVFISYFVSHIFLLNRLKHVSLLFFCCSVFVFNLCLLIEIGLLMNCNCFVFYPFFVVFRKEGRKEGEGTTKFTQPTSHMLTDTRLNPALPTSTIIFSLDYLARIYYLFRSGTTNWSWSWRSIIGMACIGVRGLDSG